MLIYINKYRDRYNIDPTHSCTYIWMNVSILTSEFKEKMINNIANRAAWKKPELSFPLRLSQVIRSLKVPELQQLTPPI